MSLKFSDNYSDFTAEWLAYELHITVNDEEAILTEDDAEELIEFLTNANRSPRYNDITMEDEEQLELDFDE